MVERHGEVARETFVEGFVKKWNLDSFSHGAFIMHGAYQRHLYMVS